MPIVALGQKSLDEFYGHFPKSIKISADSIKEISIAVYTQIEVDYTYDTIIKLPNSKISAFIDDFNNNVIESSNKQREHKFFSSNNYGKKYYVITFISKNNNEMFYYLKGQIIGISIGDDLKYSKTGTVSLFYKLKNKNILNHYLIR